MKEGKILFSESGKLVIIRIIGKGSWVESKYFLEFCKKKMEEGKKVVVDLSECNLLDSTFLGILAYLSIHYQKIQIFQPQERVEKSIKTLGLEKILKKVRISLSPNKEKELKGGKLSPQDRARLLYLAHKTIVDVSPDNLPKFKDLLELLEEESGKI